VPASIGASTPSRSACPTRFPDMELRIGVVESPKELSLELDGTADDVIKAIEDALGSDARRAMLWLTDVKGRRVGTPADRIAYVEIEEEGTTQHVGFGR
jgi:hypothetical protein